MDSDLWPRILVGGDYFGLWLGLIDGVEMINPKLFRRSVEAEKISLEKLGYSAERTDKRKLSYVRGYIWRNYRVRIKPPLDYIILCMLMDVALIKER